MAPQQHDLVTWPPLHDGANEPGPTDLAGEYRAAEQQAPGEHHAGLATGANPAVIPGEVRPWEQPIDIASRSAMPVQPPDGRLTEAERSVRDQRHITRGKPSMSSNEGSS
jgi:hypothetical protein